MTLVYLLNWAANIVIVVVLPARIGVLGAPLWFFAGYALIAGAALMLVEDVRYAREVFVRSDVRDYLSVRIAIVAAIGIVPFVFGRLISW